MVVEVEQHAFKMRLNTFPLKSLRLLNEYVYTRERVFWVMTSPFLSSRLVRLNAFLGMSSKNFFFCFEVVFDSLVIIQVVARKIGEDAAGKLQTADTLLCDRVGADFHECVFASGVCHLTQQAVKGNRVGVVCSVGTGRSSM